MNIARTVLNAARALYKNNRCLNVIKSTKGFLGQQSSFGDYEVVSPRVSSLSGRRAVPAHIERPPWADTGASETQPSSPPTYSGEQLRLMRRACRLAALILHETGARVQVGVSTDQLDQFAHELCIRHAAYPSPLNYSGFPRSVCTSVNNVACHGIPDSRPLACGDIVTIDVSVYVGGYHGDCSWTFVAGQADEQATRLVNATKRCLIKAISVCGPGVSISRIGESIESEAESQGYAVVVDFIGHGIGQCFHGPPDVYHCRNNSRVIMTPGMTFTIEPILAQGGGTINVLSDGWTAVMQDEGRAAQFEHTVLVTDSGVQVLTQC